MTHEVDKKFRKMMCRYNLAKFLGVGHILNGGAYIKPPVSFVVAEIEDAVFVRPRPRRLLRSPRER